MSAAPEQLEREIAATRSELTRTLRELQERTSPVAIVQRNKPRIVAAGVVTAAVLVGLTTLAVLLKRR